MESLKPQYIKLIANKVCVSVEYLSKTELQILDCAFDLFQEKLDEISMLSDDLRRVNIELLNLKAMLDDSENNYE